MIVESVFCVSLTKWSGETRHSQELLSQHIGNSRSFSGLIQLRIPVEKNGQVYSKIPPPRSKEFGYYGKYTNTGSHLTYLKQNNASEPDLTKSTTPPAPANETKKSTLCKTFQSFIPKMNLNLEKVTEQNPRILDLRQKLNEITKKQDRNVDKQTKALINDITQQLDDKNESESGPYSLLFELQSSEPSTSQETANKKITEIGDNSSNCKTRIFNNKLPNIIDLDNKPMKEFEYSCESELNAPPNKTFNLHSRSDLCLHFKPHVQSIFENITPNDSSISRTNEENSLDDSLGILTPDQMDGICYLDNAFSPTVEGLPIFCDNDQKNSPDNGDTPSTDKTESNSAASTMFFQSDDLNRKDKEQLDNLNQSISSVTIKLSQSSDAIGNNDLNYKGHLPYDTTEETRYASTPSDCCINVKEEFVTSLLEDEVLPSIHSSILEPISSVTDMNINLDLSLDCKHKENHMTVQRIEQTPSPEELPLDTSDLHGDISTYSSSQFSTSTLHDSHTYSDIKNEFTKSIETPKVSNSFITSVTSITSLDGYQGDGEMSRPVSRGADHSIREEIIEMDWQNVPVARRPEADPMTDSDFFTESDADGLDDHMHRGDRKAQVIDGALYGGKNNNGNPPLIVNRNEDSCMDSSGVYTDLENHRSSPVFLNAIDDMSPEGSSVSTQSECSQKNGNQANGFFEPNAVIKPQNLEGQVDTEDSKINITITPINDKEICKDIIPKEEKKSFTLKKYKMPKRDVPSKIKTIMNRKADADSSVQNSPKNVKKTDRRENLAKKNSSIETKNEYKTKSFKDIKSKIDCSFSIQRSQTACSVTRLLSSKSTNSNTKPKSRHMRMRMELGSANGSGKSSLHSSQSDISASSSPLGKHSTSRFPLLRNGKKREPITPQATPAHAPVSPQQPPTIVKKNGVAVVQKLASSPGSVRARTSLAPPPSPRKPAARRAPAQRPTTLPTNKEPPRVTVAVGPRGKRAGPQTPHGPPTRSSPAPRPPSPVPAPVFAPKPTEQAAALANAAKGVEALGVLVQYLVFRLDALNSGAWKSEAVRWRSVAAAEKSSAALAALERKQRAQKDYDTIAECSTRISELEIEVLEKEKANARLVAAGNEADHKYRSALHEISTLAADIKGLKDTIESLKRDVAESRQRLHAQGEIERTLRAQLDAAREELAQSYENSHVKEPSCEAATACDTALTPNECNGHGETALNGFDDELELKVNTRGELSKDPTELAAEVQSLRAVLELKQAEAASLRSARTELLAERERRTNMEREARAARHAAEELRERAIARQRDADILKDDNRRLREAAARDRDHAARLATLNEELRYKLRQNSQVLSLITGGSLRTRTVSNDSARSPSPAPDSPPSPAASPAPDTPPVPAVKGVVEKHDSVSWVLEIEETPEEVASRLARRSSFRTAASPSGVKRRGGASPGNGSPAPASPAPNASKLFRPGELDFPPPPPPLKESAGEAIYIYNDRQY